MNERGETPQTGDIMKTGLKVTAALAAAALLGACAGGGGGGGGESDPEVPLHATSEQKSDAEIAECLIYPTYCREKEKLKNSLQCLLDPLACYRYLEKFKREDEKNLEASGTRSTLPSGLGEVGNPSDATSSVGEAMLDPVAFSTWRDYPGDAGVKVIGLSATAVLSRSADGERLSTLGTGYSDSGTATLYYEPAGTLREFRTSAASYVPRSGSSQFPGRSRIDMAWASFNLDATAYGNDPADHAALVANPYGSGWDYQSFGVWTEPGVPSREFVRALSFGAPTPGPAIPTSGAAAFTGSLAGMYVSSAGKGGIAAADLDVQVDFSQRSLSLASSGTTFKPDLGAAVSAPRLNLGGTLSYAPGSNAFSGTLTNAGGTMSGTSNGQFYGPAAQELGGVFVVKSPSTVETFTGAYGAKR